MRTYFLEWKNRLLKIKNLLKIINYFKINILKTCIKKWFNFVQILSISIKKKMKILSIYFLEWKNHLLKIKNLFKIINYFNINILKKFIKKWLNFVLSLKEKINFQHTIIKCAVRFNSRGFFQLWFVLLMVYAKVYLHQTPTVYCIHFLV